MCVACTHPSNPPQTRFQSHTFKIPVEELAIPTVPIFDEVRAKLLAEQRRLERLLPEAPAGAVWVPEIQSNDDENFSENKIAFRVVYRLKEAF